MPLLLLLLPPLPRPLPLLWLVAGTVLPVPAAAKASAARRSAPGTGPSSAPEAPSRPAADTRRNHVANTHSSWAWAT
jgi:hypothetical protein